MVLSSPFLPLHPMPLQTQVHHSPILLFFSPTPVFLCIGQYALLLLAPILLDPYTFSTELSPAEVC